MVSVAANLGMALAQDDRQALYLRIIFRLLSSWVHSKVLRNLRPLSSTGRGTDRLLAGGLPRPPEGSFIGLWGLVMGALYTELEGSFRELEASRWPRRIPRPPTDSPHG